MAIKRIGGVISAYKPAKTTAPKKTSAAVSAKSNTDRVEFGFETALAAAKSAIAQAANSDASLSEIRDAQKALEQGVSGADIAAMMFMG